MCDLVGGTEQPSSSAVPLAESTSQQVHLAACDDGHESVPAGLRTGEHADLDVAPLLGYAADTAATEERRPAQPCPAEPDPPLAGRSLLISLSISLS